MSEKTEPNENKGNAPTGQPNTGKRESSPQEPGGKRSGAVASSSGAGSGLPGSGTASSGASRGSPGSSGGSTAASAGASGPSAGASASGSATPVSGSGKSGTSASSSKPSSDSSGTDSGSSPSSGGSGGSGSGAGGSGDGSGGSGGGSGGSTGLGFQQDPQEKEAREELLEQFYSTLRVMHLAANKDDEPNAPFAEQHKRINELFQTKQHSWLDAYEIEQLLSFVITDEQLAAELPRRMAEAKVLNLQYVTAMEERFKAIVEDETKAEEDADRDKCQDAKRYLMQRVLNDLQWFYKQRIRRRDAAKRLALRVSAMFLSAFFFFSTLLFIQYLSIPKNENGDPKQGQSSEEAKPPAGAPKEAK